MAALTGLLGDYGSDDDDERQDAGTTVAKPPMSMPLGRQAARDVLVTHIEPLDLLQSLLKATKWQTQRQLDRDHHQPCHWM